MTIWEKTIVNMEKGSKKIAAFAATFSDRVKMEIAVTRLRIKISEAESRIDELHQAIGKRIVSLSRENALPDKTELLLKDDAVHSAMTELANREQEVVDLKSDAENIRKEYSEGMKQTEETLK